MVRFLTVFARYTRLLVLLPSLACAMPDEPVAFACPAPDLDTRQWQDVLIENAGAVIRMPPGATEPFPSDPPFEVWSAEGSSVLATISEDRENLPAWVAAIVPLPSWKSHRSDCVEHVASTPARFQAYFERWGNLAAGRYVATGAYELVPGSWLVIAGVSRTSQRQQEVLAALRTARFLPPAGSVERPRAPDCTVGDAPGADWLEFQESSAPITFRAPPGSAMRARYTDGHEMWAIGPTRVDFKLLGTRNWVFGVRPGSKRCSMTVDDRHYTEVRLAPGLDTSSFSDAMAYIQISPTRVLSIHGYVYGDRSAPERFFGLLRSLRVRPNSLEPPHN